MTPTPGVRVNWSCCQVDAPDMYNLANEWVCFQNYGVVAQSMTGWYVKDEYGWTYTFPGFTLNPGARVRLHTGSGTDTATALYWGRHSYVWTNSGDVIELYDAAWVLVDSYSY